MKSRHAASWLCTALSAILLFGCATLPKDFDRPVSYALPDTGDTRLAHATRREVETHPGQSAFVPLPNGLDAFVARAVMAEFADRSIDAQYYLLHKDLTGTLFLYQLVKAADRGVRVRLLVDDMDLSGRDLGAAVMDSHPNIEVRIFNPFSRNTARAPQFLTRFGSVTRRMHNKSFTVDNRVTILGGRNIGDEYFEARPDVAFADLDVMAIGKVADDVSSAFDLYWNSELAYPASVLMGRQATEEEIGSMRKKLDEYAAQQADSEYIRALRDSHLANDMRQDKVRFYWGKAHVIYDKPEKVLHDRGRVEYHLAPQLAPYFEKIQKELILFSPYFVPGKEGTAFLTDLSRRGIQVRILTNSLSSTDVGIVHAGYSKYRQELLRGGVQLYELNKKIDPEVRRQSGKTEGSSRASLHTKSFVFDRTHVFIGSLNLDPRSVAENTEIGVVLESEELAAEMAQWFVHNIDKVAFRLELAKGKDGSEKILWHGKVDGKEETFDVDPYTGFWRRFGVGFMSLLPIESQL